MQASLFQVYTKLTEYLYWVSAGIFQVYTRFTEYLYWVSAGIFQVHTKLTEYLYWVRCGYILYTVCQRARRIRAVLSPTPPHSGSNRVQCRGLNYESGLKRWAGLNLKAIDNGPKMVTMDRDYTKSGPNLGPKQPLFRLAISLD